ncbi:MAG: hypothetical protein JJ843_00900 [Prochlorococcus marinus CUG1434]|nr:hypothetical protein [Prochlorococcus marinus CUG1434]
MNKFIEKNLSALLLAITCYFLFSVSNSLKETSKYNSDLRACAKMKAYINDKDKSELFKQKAAATSEVPVKFISEYCKKLTQQNLF